MRTFRFAFVLSCAFACFAYSSQAGGIRGFGSAFFINSDGYLLTCHHVIKGEGVPFIVYQGREYRADTVDIDPVNDLALLKIEASNTPYLKLCQRDEVRVGQDVLATGFPNPLVQGNDVKITDGMISCLSGVQGSKKQIQTSAPIQAGNSGGPLINRETGDVAGIIVSTLKQRPFNGRFPECVNYAIKSHLVKSLLSKHGRFDEKKLSENPIDLVLKSTVQVLRKTPDLEDDLVDFIYSYFEGNVDGSNFSPRLESYFRENDVTRNDVLASLAEHRKSWPVRTYEVEHFEIQDSETLPYSVQVNYRYDLINGTRKNRGNASALFRINRSASGEDFCISSIVENSRQSSIKKEAPRKSVRPYHFSGYWQKMDSEN